MPCLSSAVSLDRTTWFGNSFCGVSIWPNAHTISISIMRPRLVYQRKSNGRCNKASPPRPQVLFPVEEDADFSELKSSALPHSFALMLPTPR